jgi:hypothetical protein
MALTWGPNLNDQVSAAGLRYKPAKRYWLNGSVNLELGAQYAVTKDEKVHPWPEYRKSATPGQSLSYGSSSVVGRLEMVPGLFCPVWSGWPSGSPSDR